MPTVSQMATVTTSKEIKLKPSIRTRLMKELRVYAELKGQLDALKLAMDKHKGVIGQLRDETGEQSIKIEGFTVSLVAPMRSVLNHKKLISLGCAATWIEEATETKPSKSYEKISCPGSDDE